MGIEMNLQEWATSFLCLHIFLGLMTVSMLWEIVKEKERQTALLKDMRDCMVRNNPAQNDLED